ncbi:MAG: peptidoglycan DD-metalloendopeptidase family protein [Bacteroidales bacterium]|nr:peptidoglycan DD-metalloendopeptidase family protein [Bacteroidales bacterium]MBR2227030.1 peptidoglycan DD-metalloendopeptidase family protein [Bacteroidales bacterium]MBR3096348.1 peptidoglycan DD-metalloendopeptidase family protein [Bacteroidales bacterium]MBR4687739.1 peptidoglycan DD-metalloendopeptidase family protein [Bacteroidales bacterium]
MIFKTLLTTSLLITTSISLLAQERNTADSLRHNFGRMSVSSSHSTSTPYADTLDTENPGVKVVLFNNGTFRYIKDRKAVADSKVFTEYWDTRSVNPYHDTKPIPDNFSLWIVDTLDSYCCPNKTTPSSKFGYRHGRRHQGIDLPYPTGTPVYAAFDGKVRVSDYVGGYGNLVIIRHANGLETYYGHMSRRDVAPGDWVNAGDVIGLGGSTGRSSGPHLHFETRYQGYAFDPAWLIDFETGTLRHRLLRFRSWYFNPNSRYVQSVDDEDEIYRTDEEERLLAEQQAKKEAEARAAAEKAARKYYTVRSGDTLGKIAQKNHTTVRALCRLNGIKETTTLQIGRRLRVR